MNRYDKIVSRLRMLCKQCERNDMTFDSEFGEDVKSLLVDMVTALYVQFGSDCPNGKCVRTNVKGLRKFRVNEDTIRCMCNTLDLIYKHNYKKALVMLQSMIYDLTIYIAKRPA